MLALAIAASRNGVDYVPGEGAFCPFCRERVRAYKTAKGRPRVRYCHCTTHGCPICEMAIGIKAVEP
jgi:hypothetical protein